MPVDAAENALVLPPPRVGVERVLNRRHRLHGGRNERSGWPCHCGAVRFEATLSDGFNSILRCTCSYCRMRGAVVVMAEMGGIKFLQGEDALKATASIPDQRSTSSVPAAESTHIINGDRTRILCRKRGLPGRGKPVRFRRGSVIDGVNHTSDTGKPTRRAGTLRFIPAD